VAAGRAVVTAEDQVRAYYDRHTRTFLSRGHGGRLGAIHRAVWGPGVSTRDEAFAYIEERIADVIRTRAAGMTAAPRVWDLGCGVGATLCHLAAQLPIRATGVTISPLQAGLASDRIRAAGLVDRVRCIEGSYLALPADAPSADVAYAIESFVHAASASDFFAACHRLLGPGGTLILCDDFRRPGATGRAAAAAIERFREGWHVGALLDREELTAVAGAHGFAVESAVDLTPWLELGRGRDRAFAAAAALVHGLLRFSGAGRQPAVRRCVNARWGYWLGGAALQTCLSRGWIGYDFVVLRRV
jgi:tocopherol O-methyltransferase